MAKSKSKSERSRLLKLGFKSVFTHKLFTVLMMILIFISGTTYTLLVSSSNSFNSSYNKVVNQGNLHEYIIKENFHVNGEIGPAIKVYDGASNKPITDANLEAAAKAGQDTSGNYHMSFVIDGATGDYASQNGTKKSITINDDGDSDFVHELATIKKEQKAFQSRIEFLVERKVSEDFVNQLKTKYATEALFNENRSISVDADKKAFNIVRYNPDTEVNKLFMYDGTNKITTALTEAELVREVNLRIDDTGNLRSDYEISTTKGFRVTARTKTGSSIVVTDPSSYQAIVSPAYANANGVKSITPSKFLEMWQNDQDIMNKIIKDKALAEKYTDNLVWVDKTPYFVVGVGTTPDYSYPIIDQAHPVIDVHNQATLFVNQRGYERIYDAFRTNPTEDYISLKFKGGVSSVRKDAILKEIESTTRAKSNYPSNINLVTSAFDKNDHIILAQERVAFLKDLQKTVNTISYVTTTLLVIFVAAIVILIFRMIISMDKKVLATQLSLGYTKTKIALTKGIGALFIVGVPVFFAYIIGYAMQFWFIDEFSNYWTLPTWGSSFSLIALLITVIVPIITIFGLIFAITMFTLRKPLPSLLKGTSGTGSSWIAKTVSKFAVLGVKGKYSVALMARNSFKLALVAVASTISIIALVVGISSMGQADRAYNATMQMTNYEFAVDLYSPTAQGGDYRAIYRGDLSDPTKVDRKAPTGTPVNTDPTWHIPGLGDSELGMASTASTHLADASNYLKYKIQVKPLLDKSVGGMNPWDIAKRLMPDNQKNKAEENASEIQQITGTTTFNKIDSALSQTGENRLTPYMITYDIVVKDNGDEEYTYLDANFKSKDFRIYGVKDNTSMLNLGSDLSKVKGYKGTNLPILINHYISEKYNLKNGSVFDVDINNGYHRMEKNNTGIHTKAEVVGVVDGYDDKGLYTTQTRANAVLQAPTNSFNGVFTKEKSPTLLGTLPLYSPSGLWIGTDTIVGQWENVLDSMLSDNNIWGTSQQLTASSRAEFLHTYSRTPFVGATSSVQWNEISKFTFKNISELSSFMISMVEAIAITLSIIFTVIIASLLLISNRKKIATLWTMGYRKREISKMFLATYIIPTIVSIAIAIPVALAILIGMKAFIMGFGNILIPFSIVWFAPIIAILVVAGIFIAATLLTINTQKQQKALEAFKGD